MNATGAFSANLAGLSANTTYYFQAKAAADNMTVYGAEKSFTTLPAPWEWQRTFGGVGDDHGYSVQPTADDGYIIGGQTSSFGAGDGDVYLVKTDSSGSMTWSQTFGGTTYDYSNSVQVTPDSGYIIAGGTYSFGAGDQDVWLVKVAEEVTVLPGDVNGDGRVNALDITKVERIIARLDAATPGADANQDGEINALDITKVERIIVRLD